MEYGEQNGAAGKVPEFGAIFMSNISTKKECFRRKLFGLPLSMANFAKQVKAGMILFLFEFERRELFGVFRATSSGAINIVPNAFSSSGSFPAQVRVATIWFCSPLSEDEFRDAIKENYFSIKKFNFGLSEEQVHRLLCLFGSRKLKKRVPRRQFVREVTIPFGKDQGQIDDDTTSDIVEFEPNVKKVDYARFPVGHMIESEDHADYDNGRDILVDYTGYSWGKRRRIDDDNETFMGNVRENDNYEYRASQQTLWNEHNRDSLVEERRVANDGLFFTNDRIKIEQEMNNSSPLRRVKVAADDGGFLMNNISVENERNIGKRGISESRFFLNDRLENKLNVDRWISPVVSTQQLGDHVGRRASEIKFDNSFSSAISTDYSRYTLGEDRLIANDGKDIDNLYRPVISPNHTASVYLRKPLEKEYSSPLGRLKEMPVFDRPYYTSHDVIVTRPVPFDPKSPDLNYLNLNYRSPSKVKSTPHHSEFESLRKRLDFPLRYGNKVPLPEVLPEFQKIKNVSTPIHIHASNHLNSPSYVTGNRLSLSGFTENTLYHDPSSEYIPLPLENETKRLSCAFDNGYLVEPHQDLEYKMEGPENNEVVPRIEFPSSDVGGSRYEPSAKARDDNVQPQSSGSMHSDNQNDRQSVFERLTLAPKVRVQEQDNRMQAVHNKYDTDTSVDDIMNFSRKSKNCQVMTRKYKPLVRRYDNDENIRVKDFFAIHDTIKYEQSMIKTAEEEADAELKFVVNQIIKKSGEPLLEETRVVDFKRRSAMKKNLDETTTKDSVGNAEPEGQFGNTEELVGKPCKRRKLVRPDFSKKDPTDESFSSESILNLMLPSDSDTCPNVEVIRGTCSTSFEGDNGANTEQKGNLGRCGDGTETSTDILNRLSYLLSKVKSRNVGVGSSDEDSMADLAA